MRTSALFGAKIIAFFEVYGVSVRTGEEEAIRAIKKVAITAIRGGNQSNQFFAILCGRSL